MAPQPPPSPSAGSPEAPPERPEVLVVDDDPTTRLVVRTMLESHGWVVNEAADGRDAMRQIEQRGGLSLVILDLALPDLDGVEVLRKTRESLRTAGIPVVVLTGREGKETERRMLMEGAADFIRKPFDPAIFLARARAAMRRHAS